MSEEIQISFADLALSAPVLEAVKAVGYEQPSPIQAESIPYLLEGHDLLGMAQTGTGKTAAFALPALSRIDVKSSDTQVLVLAPTRELAIQVAEAFQTYAAKIKNFHVLPIYGGADYRGQLRGLKRGAQVVVGTPGRVMDHLERGSLKLNNLKTVVLDEADEMLRMGFIDDVTWILDHTPDERQVALFSATMPKEIKKVADTYLSEPKEVKIKAQTATVERIKQSYWQVRGTNKLDALTRILEVEDFDGVIIFARTKTATAELADKLEARGYASAALNGDMSQQLRERVIDRLKKSELDIVVATDVAARGIDVARVSHVINYDIPYDAEAYVHRIGRTGRAGREGKAILFVAPRERRMLRIIEKVTRQPIEEMDLPSREQVVDIRIAQFKEQIVETYKNEKLGAFKKLIKDFIAEQAEALNDPEHEKDPDHDKEPLELSVEDVAAALAFMAQKDKALFMPKEKVRKSKDRPEFEPRERGDRGERGDRKDRKGRREDDGIPRETYRLEVGRSHHVKPGDIVGCIANEADLDSKYIGQISLYDEFSTVDLPEGMPPETFQALRDVFIRGQKIELKLDTKSGNKGRSSRGPKSDKGFRGSKPGKDGKSGKFSKRKK